MRKEISILIPTYNDRCTHIVRQVREQARAIDGLKYEIVIGDDGSDNEDVVRENRENGAYGDCRYLRFEENRGRSAIRNSLADAALYGWLLFIDSGNVSLSHKDWLRNYLSSDESWQVVSGGYVLAPLAHKDKESNLRYKFERRSRQNAVAEMRRKSDSLDFHTTIFMARRDVLQRVRFNENLQRYGYEDVLMGKQMQKSGIAVHHIDNPALFFNYDDNDVFLRKTDESIETLKEFGDELRGYSRLIATADRLRAMHLDGVFRLLYRVCGKMMRRNLTGEHPSLLVFNIYKTGRLLSI